MIIAQKVLLSDKKRDYFCISRVMAEGRIVDPLQLKIRLEGNRMKSSNYNYNF